ncbi:MAG: soluble lytic murein transglycosylase-like protein [Paenibacillaceae bacterium]|jgi:soluble lytic murein transglycosylase|nr:soluble lytic murein transglycosylase-like protein [Paenibacillaceae bacterium]
MKSRQKKRWFALVLLLLVLVLFYRSEWISRLIYPIMYRDEIEQAAADVELDPRLVAAVIRVESNYRPQAESGKGAVGIMQVMPLTAKSILQERRFEGLTLREMEQPEVNIRVGTAYLSTLLRMYDQDLVKALASYNAGPGNVNEWLEQGVWDGSLESVDNIPFGETSRYVRKVMYYYHKYQELYEYADKQTEEAPEAASL